MYEYLKRRLIQNDSDRLWMLLSTCLGRVFGGPEIKENFKLQSRYLKN